MGNITYGTQDINTRANAFNELSFLIDTKLSRINTIKLCVVTKVNADKTVDVRSLLPQIDGNNEPVMPIEWHSFPILCVQGGNGALIIEYAVGDIVIVGFCDRDIQGIKRSKKITAPSTSAVFPLSSGLVLGAVLTNHPTVYISVTDKIRCVGNVEVANNLSVTGVTNTNGGIDSTSYKTNGTEGATLTFVDLNGVSHTVQNGLIIS